MEQQTLVDTLRLVVLNGLADELLENWINPQGRLQSNERRERAEWVKHLSDLDRRLMKDFGDEAARAALFGVLAVLDGSRAIENAPRAGHLELRYVTVESSELLASSAPDLPVMPLHELL